MNTLLRLLPLLLLLSSPALAMCISTNYTPLAWTKDGNAVVIEEGAGGPEGGGSTSFIVIDFKKKRSEVFMLSSTFSPGDGSEPQSVSEEACKTAVAKANQLITKLGFEFRLKAPDKACRKDRDDLFTGKEKKDLSIDFEKVGMMATQVGLPGRGASATAFTKNGKNSIIIENDGKCEARCYRVKSGPKPDTYKNDGPCQGE